MRQYRRVLATSVRYREFGTRTLKVFGQGVRRGWDDEDIERVESFTVVTRRTVNPVLDPK